MNVVGVFTIVAPLKAAALAVAIAFVFAVAVVLIVRCGAAAAHKAESQVMSKSEIVQRLRLRLLRLHREFFRGRAGSTFIFGPAGVDFVCSSVQGDAAMAEL